MSEEDKKKEDVKENSSNSSKSDEDKSKSNEDDKEKNFAELREKVNNLEEENQSLQQKLSGDSERSLGEDTEVEDETQKVIFNRDKKKAVRKFNREHDVSDEEWNQMRSKVALKGDEDDDLIFEKMQEAHESLPSVKKRREKELIEKGKKEAMSQFSDEEMDIGGGGEAGGSSSETPNFSSQEKRFLDAMGVSEEERKDIKK